MPSFTDVIIIGLAAHRLWDLWFVAEFLRPVRERVWRLDGPVGKWAAYGSSCQFCVSVWCGFIALAAWLAHPLIPVALAAGAVLWMWQAILTRVMR